MSKSYFDRHDFDVMVLEVTKEIIPGSTVDSYKPGYVRLYHLDDSKGSHISPCRTEYREFCFFLAGIIAARDKMKPVVPDYLIPILNKAGYTGARLFDLITEGKV